MRTTFPNVARFRLCIKTYALRKIHQYPNLGLISPDTKKTPWGVFLYQRATNRRKMTNLFIKLL